MHQIIWVFLLHRNIYPVSILAYPYWYFFDILAPPIFIFFQWWGFSRRWSRICVYLSCPSSMIWSIILQRINEHNNKKIDAGILLVQTGKASSKGASSRKNSDTRRPPGTIQYYLARHAPRQSHTFVRHSINKFFLSFCLLISHVINSNAFLNILPLFPQDPNFTNQNIFHLICICMWK